MPAGPLTIYNSLSVSDVIYGKAGNSANWNLGYTGFTNVTANSARLNSNVTTTNANSANWTNAYTNTNANSARWNSTFTTTNANSASWTNASSTVSALSATWSLGPEDSNTIIGLSIFL